MPMDIAKLRSRLEELYKEREAVVAERLRVQAKERHGPILEGRWYLSALHGKRRFPASDMTRMEATLMRRSTAWPLPLTRIRAYPPRITFARDEIMCARQCCRTYPSGMLPDRFDRYPGSNGTWSGNWLGDPRGRAHPLPMRTIGTFLNGRRIRNGSHVWIGSPSDTVSITDFDDAAAVRQGRRVLPGARHPNWMLISDAEECGGEFPVRFCRGVLVHTQSARRRIGNRIARMEKHLFKAEGDDDEVSVGVSSPERRVKRARGGVKQEAHLSPDDSSSDSSSEAMPGSAGDKPATPSEPAEVKAEAVEPSPPPAAAEPAVAAQPALPVAEQAPVEAPAVPGPLVAPGAVVAPKARARGRPPHVEVPIGECRLCWPREHGLQSTRFGHDTWCPHYRGGKNAA